MSSQSFHFISGLPRAGSTLLSALLLQNPRFHAGMTSPVGALFTHMVSLFSAGSEFGLVISQTQRSRLLRGLFDNYYADQADKQVVFDTVTDYDLLAHAPEHVLRPAREFISKPWFKHDFDNVAYDAPEFE